MIFDRDKFAANLNSLRDGYMFTIKYDGIPEIDYRFTTIDSLNCYQMVGHGLAIVFDDWEYIERFDSIDFYRRYVTADGNIDRMSTGFLSIYDNPYWTISDLGEKK